MNAVAQRGLVQARALEPRPALVSARRGPSLWLRLARKPLGVAGAVVVTCMVLLAIGAPLIAPYDPYLVSASERFSPPGAAHIFGTDDLGRDIFSRIAYGARISLGVSLAAVAIGTTLGALIGLVSGFFSGLLDETLQRLVDILLAFPALVLAMAVVAVIGSSSLNVALAIAVAILPTSARVVRSAVLTVKTHPYIDAARVIGCRDARILFRHVFPNVLAPWIVLVTVGLGGALIAEASLSFLGLGVQPPSASWGAMLSGSGRTYAQYAPWLGIFPGLAISLTVLAMNFMGDALRDALDPRLRQI